jgi:hypothetical protein
MCVGEASSSSNSFAATKGNQMKSLLFATVATLGLLAASSSNAQTAVEQKLLDDMSAGRSTLNSLLDPKTGSIVGYAQDRIQQATALNDYWWHCIHDAACNTGWKDLPEKPAMASVTPATPKQP